MAAVWREEIGGSETEPLYTFVYICSCGGQAMIRKSQYSNNSNSTMYFTNFLAFKFHSLLTFVYLFIHVYLLVFCFSHPILGVPNKQKRIILLLSYTCTTVFWPFFALWSISIESIGFIFTCHL